jgi:hypothetical protein
MPLNARQLLDAIGGKALQIPKEGWNARTFARHGQALLVTMARTAKITQRRAATVVARTANDIFRQQLERVIKKVEKKLKSAGGKNAMRELLFPAHEALWMQAIEEVFREEGIEVVTRLVPPIQSTMAQGYSKTQILMGQETDVAVSSVIARESREIAAKITRINETTRQQFRRQIATAMDEGLTVTETAERMRQVMPTLNGSRSLTIARTELNRAWTAGAIKSMQQSSTITHVSVIGCEAREDKSPQYRGESTCNIQDVPIEDAHTLEFHINHTGTVVPSRFKDEDGRDDPNADRPNVLDKPPTGGDWSPVMAMADAVRFSEGGAFSGRMLYHFTDERGAAGIMEEGFRESDGIYGRGIYLTTDRAGETIGRAHANRRLDVMINAQNPLEVRGFSGLMRWMEANHPKSGHDALVIKFSGDKPDFVMVFNRQNATVIEKIDPDAGMRR